MIIFRLKKPPQIVDMAANGQLVFTDVDKVTFKGVGNTSNAVIDTTTGKIGVGVDSPDANLHVLGNCFVSTNFELGGTMTMGTVTVRAQHELSAITATGNTTPHTVEFQNATTGLVTTGNVEVGGELSLVRLVDVGANSRTRIGSGSGGGTTINETNQIAIGEESGYNNQGQDAIAIGRQSGWSSQSSNTVAIGTFAGAENQSSNAVAVGYQSGNVNQSLDAVAIGYQAGQSSQGDRAVAIGNGAGRAGSGGQGQEAIAIGNESGNWSQSSKAVAVGTFAGKTDQGHSAIAIGYLAGETAQGDNSIILNATGVALDSTTASSFHVKPVRGGNYAASALAYTGDGEIVEETNMHFDTAGNVGIGTTSPDRKLHVKYDTGSWDNTTGAAVIIEDPGSIGAGITLKPTGSGVTNGTDGWALYAGSTSGSVGDGNIGFWAHGTNKAPFRVHRNGNIILLDSPSTGEVIVGDTSTTYDPAIMNTSVTSTPTNPILHVNGSIQLKSDNDAIVIGNNNATFLKDEELHFGWGGGWYMTDGTLLRVVNNKKIYSTGAARFGLQLLLDAYGDENSTNCLFIGTNTSSQNLRIGCNSTGEYCWIQSHAGKPLRLNPAGNQVQYGTGNTVLSDDRIKTNEVYIENATDTLLKLKPQIYDKKLVWNISKLGETSNVNVVKESGLITQDVWYDAPELRHLVNLGDGAEPGEDKPVTDNDPTNDPDYSSWGDNVSLLDYMGLIPYIIKSNQEIYTTLQAEKVKVTTLESQLTAVLARIDALENA